MRGEYKGHKGYAKSIQGSPPHAWGILGYTYDEVKTERITPTCVGNTDINHSCPDWNKDHPHMRGEYSLGRTRQALSRGSPPRAWGILKEEFISTHSLRFTPTCVGNTVAISD